MNRFASKKPGIAPVNPDVKRNENAYAGYFIGDPTSKFAAATSPAGAVKWWMNSEGHRNTLLDRNYKETGVG